MAETRKKTKTSDGKGKAGGSKSGENKGAAPSKEGVNRAVMDNIVGVCLMALGVFVFAAVQLHIAGQLGNTFGDLLKGVFGLVALILPIYLLVLGALLFTNRNGNLSWRTFLFSFIILLMICLINSGRFIDSDDISYRWMDYYASGIELNSGGLFGMMLGSAIVAMTGKIGLYIISVLLILICALLLINKPVSSIVEKIADGVEKAKQFKAGENEETDEEEEAEEKPEQISMPVILANPYDTVVADRTERKNRLKNLLGYMKDDKLFEKDITSFDSDKAMAERDGHSPENAEEAFKGESEPHVSYGLEGRASGSVIGYGLDGGLDRTEVRYGLDGALSPTSVGIKGYGLDGDDYNYKGTEGDEGAFSADDDMREQECGGIEASGRNLSQAELRSLMPDVDTTPKKRKYRKPPMYLLKLISGGRDPHLAADLKAMAAKLEETLKNFNVDAKVVQVTRGPAVTRYEIQPGIGVKVSSIARLSDDIALNLKAKSIRIEAPIPGKAAVGIEVENDKITMVSMREMVGSPEFKNAESKIAFAVGKDIAGKAVVADLAAMPHLLIAGSTGSGKSVCVNSIITSILYRADPDEVKLVLIDPKVVELGNYNGIPHLLIPVVTEPTKAAAALNWAVAEMTDRYKKFAERNVRNLSGYNRYMKEIGETDSLMPQIVIIIDELADLMMAAPSQVEESICRLAQMARAAGMHLIVATQRPSVDIITGVIKANIPSRIAFAVSSQFDSRTILDMSGAEKLVGRGDMLFNPLGTGKPTRIQGCFISDDEVSAVIDFIKSQNEEDPEYSSEVMSSIEKGVSSPSGGDEDTDEFLSEAIECVVHAGQASVSMLQRRFRIGYNRAARMVEMMEERGIVGPQDGSRPRQVLLTEDELNAMKEEALEQ